MPTIKELAREANVSPSTVSIVLNGKSLERGITQATQDRVNDAVRKLGYRTNVSAKRLRSESASDVVIVTLFWASDLRTPLMVRFLRGIQRAVRQWDRRCEITIHTYENNKLHQSMEALGLCNAAIVCNASSADQEFLENYQTHLPIVLYNRSSEKYCTVNVDDRLMGELAARVFASHGRSRAALLVSDPVFKGMEERSQGFIEVAESLGLSVLSTLQEDSTAGGYQGALALASLRPLPDCLFVQSDAMAIGALKGLATQAIPVPGAVEIISIGNGDRELQEYASTALSVVNLPMEEMAEECFRLAVSMLDGDISEPVSVTLPTAYIARDSAGPMDADLVGNLPK